MRAIRILDASDDAAGRARSGSPARLAHVGEPGAEQRVHGRVLRDRGGSAVHERVTAVARDDDVRGVEASGDVEAEDAAV